MFSQDYLCFLRIFCCMMIAMTSLIWGQFNQRNWLLTLCLYLYHEFTHTINYRRWLELAQVQITKLLFFLLGFLTNIKIQVEGSLLNAANFGTQDDYHCYASSQSQLFLKNKIYQFVSVQFCVVCIILTCVYLVAIYSRPKGSCARSEKSSCEISQTSQSC